MAEYDKYIDLARQLGMTDALIISPQDICFDIRAWLKCCWGCDRSSTEHIMCNSRDTTLEERIQIVQRYSTILLLHSHDAVKLSQTILEVERAAFLDGYYFACALRTCNLCQTCYAKEGGECPHPRQVRPCEEMFGIDVYKTVRKLGLPCEVLQNKDDQQNRYGFLLIE